MYYASALIALVAISSLCISAGESDPILDKLLLDLETRCWELLQQPREDDEDDEDDEDIYPTSCLTRKHYNTSIIVQVPGHQAFPVLCDSELAGQGWLVIQRRRDGLVNFYRDWNDYKEGFGNLDGDFFIGLEKLHVLTASQDFELYVYMENQVGVSKFAKYDEFTIGNESQKFHLKNLGSYSGTAGDSLTVHKGQAFSTFDRDNDATLGKNCAQFYLGAWWYKSCYVSNLNGQYIDYKGENLVTLRTPSDYTRFMTWNSFESSGSNPKLKFVQMMIRPKFGCLKMNF